MRSIVVRKPPGMMELQDVFGMPTTTSKDFFTKYIHIHKAYRTSQIPLHVPGYILLLPFSV
jgi:hypothetical protein